MGPLPGFLEILQPPKKLQVPRFKDFMRNMSEMFSLRGHRSLCSSKVFDGISVVSRDTKGTPVFPGFKGPRGVLVPEDVPCVIYLF